jgi:hypothetical protein
MGAILTLIFSKMYHDEACFKVSSTHEVGSRGNTTDLLTGVTGSNLGLRHDYPYVSWFLSVPSNYLKFGRDRFLSHDFQFILHYHPDTRTYSVLLERIHNVVCLTTSPWPLPKRVLHRVRSSASSFDVQYLLFSLSSYHRCLRLLPRLPVTYILPSIFPSMTCFRRQFLHKM